MFCRNCGNELPEGTRFCDKCGADQTKLNSGTATPGTGANQQMAGGAIQTVNPVHTIPSNVPDFVEKYENENFLFKLLKYANIIMGIITGAILVISFFTTGLIPNLIAKNGDAALMSLRAWARMVGYAVMPTALVNLLTYLRHFMLASAATKNNTTISSIYAHMKKYFPTTSGSTVQLSMGQMRDISMTFSAVVIKRGGDGKKMFIGSVIYDVVLDFIFYLLAMPLMINWLVSGIYGASMGDSISSPLVAIFAPLLILVAFVIIRSIISTKVFAQKNNDYNNAAFSDWTDGKLTDNWEEKSDAEAIPYLEYVASLSENGANGANAASERQATSTPSGFNPYASAQPMAPLGKSEFHGSTFGLIGQAILASLVTSFTLGLAAPWAVCGFISWLLKNTKVSGRNLAFRGTGGSLFGNYLKWWFLSLITFGIYGLFVPKKLADWLAENVTFV